METRGVALDDPGKGWAQEGEGQRSAVKGPWKFHGKAYSGCLHHEVLEVSSVIFNLCVCVCVLMGIFPASISMSFSGDHVPQNG